MLLLPHNSNSLLAACGGQQKIWLNIGEEEKEQQV